MAKHKKGGWACYGPWMAAIGYEVLEKAQDEQQQEVNIKVERREKNTTKVDASILKFYL